ncbi:MAG: methyl-accepting chemotaxis protein [Flammeovirgaceae bacterium]|jgi:methyl-accepting chemotaxis protein
MIETTTIGRYVPNPRKVKQFKESIWSGIDQKMLLFLAGYFLFGIIIWFIHDTESLVLPFVVGVINITICGFYYFLKNKMTFRYLVGLHLCAFSIQFIIQMDGAIYMHLAFLLSLILLSAYGVWRMLVPFFVIMIIYYTIGIVQTYYGVDWGSYFINIPSIMNEKTFRIGLFILIFQFLFIFYLTAFINVLYNKAAKRVIYLEDQLNIENNIGLAQQVAEGNFGGAYELKDNDAMGEALLEMRESLRTVSETDKKNKWISDGITHISDILLNSVDESEICHNVLREITKYVELEHGGIFTLNNSDLDHPFLELRSFYAFDNEHFIKNKIEIGETLVGEAAARRKTIHLTDVPNSYVNILSGLGESTPKSILIKPLLVKDQLLGVLEVASLHEIAPYKLEFLDKVTANISVSLLSARAASQTAKLLQDSQVYNIQMKAQEEAMRTNMDALSQTQEALSEQVNARQKAQDALYSKMSVVNKMSIVMEISANRTLLEVNDLFTNLFGFTKEEIVGGNFGIIAPETESENSVNFMWEALEKEGAFVGVVQLETKEKKPMWIELAISPIIKKSNDTKKYLCIGFDVSELILKEHKIESLLNYSQLRNEMLNQKEETMHESLKTLEIAEEELFEQIQQGARTQDFYDLVLSFVKGVVYRSVYTEGNWQIDFISSGVYELSGYVPKDFIHAKQLKFQSLIHPKDVAKLEKELESQSDSFSVTYRIIDKDGSIKTIQEKGMHIYDTYLKTKTVIGFLYDITNLE